MLVGGYMSHVMEVATMNSHEVGYHMSSVCV